jgi:hypothetical protein
MKAYRMIFIETQEENWHVVRASLLPKVILHRRGNACKILTSLKILNFFFDSSLRSKRHHIN